MHPVRPLASFAGCPAYAGDGLSQSATIHLLPGAMVFEFKERSFLRAPAATYRHLGQKVRVNHVLLFPPWLNTVIFLRDGTGLPIYALLPPWRRRPLERAIVAAGLTLVVKRRILQGYAEWTPGE